MIEIGDRLKDNDPRMTGRVLTVTGISKNGPIVHVIAEGLGPTVRISAKRIYEDGKQRRSGFTLVKTKPNR